jgi:L-2-hydroxyglutarate oxidase
MKYDVVIIGAGLVGLSTGYQLLMKHPNLRLAIVEKEDQVATHQSSHNSGVIHSGIYYKPGSLRAINCKRGYDLLLNYCSENDIPLKICGKIILATDEDQSQRLDEIYQNGLKNGLNRLKFLDPEEIYELEPHAKGVKAVHVPETGVIDFKDVAISLANDIQKKGEILTSYEVSQIEHSGSLIHIHSGDKTIATKLMISCGGLFADKIAKLSGIEPGISIIPFRGEYYELTETGQKKVNHLIYPVPNPAFPFLGVHLTRMMNGTVEAGPNAVLALKREGYKKSDINPSDVGHMLNYNGFRKMAKKHWKFGLDEYHRSYSKSAFLSSLQQLVPAIAGDDIIKGRTGVRAMACTPSGELSDDYIIKESKGMIHVLNAPSPAATSCLSIGEHISNIASKKLQHD